MTEVCMEAGSTRKTAGALETVLRAVMEAMKRHRRNVEAQRALESLASLNDDVLRDIGLHRDAVASMTSTKGGLGRRYR